ncbi:hypothetical protein DSCW_62640 [Desulfosarcina widdelii]|uniref:DUF3786 domain-containing protein n=1 Tax=Desulfosarcina widdelii TaxID=947919 RepID=A0A5K7ZQ03_9BACT|nr:DUF3786 domain-containing protein [Desulfosarcina widdelii]BBO78847.1 hypothetical protein DSCW_62640 [Desulfosarcina widdelii]
MATGACGINCDVCQLNLVGQCSSCGPGRSDLAAGKIAAQQRILGHPCAILACARLNHIDYCPRDCPSFPCDNFSKSNYPYGRGFLDMQRRRRGLGPPALDPSGRPIEVEAFWWDKLAHRQVDHVANFTLTDIDGKTGHLRFHFLEREILVDTHARCLMEKENGEWEKIQRPMLELTVLDYFSRIDCLYPMGRKIVGSEDLSDAHYFTGRNRLPTASLRARFGADPDGFAAAGARLGGIPQQMADEAFRLTPFPRVPLYYLLWLASEEFAPSISILFDQSIDKVLSPPAIWCLVSLCNYHLLCNI